MTDQYNKKLVYTAMTKHLFYFRVHISKFVVEQGGVPLNPFMIFDYFLLDTVDRHEVRAGNNTIVARSDEIWVFGPVSNGVLAEINLAKQLNKPTRYFKVANSRDIVEITKDEAYFEDEVAEHKGTLEKWKQKPSQYYSSVLR